MIFPFVLIPRKYARGHWRAVSLLFLYVSVGPDRHLSFPSTIAVYKVSKPAGRELANTLITDLLRWLLQVLENDVRCKENHSLFPSYFEGRLEYNFFRCYGLDRHHAVF